MEEKKSCCSVGRDSISGDKMSQPEVIQHQGKSDKNGMAYIPGGQFLMGTNSEEGYKIDKEGPVRQVTVPAFYMDIYPVTNQEFNEFVNATGYKTEAEQYGWTFVFHLLVSKETFHKTTQKVLETPWWLVVEGAYWKHPEGPDSNVDERMDHPAVHISWNDANAYCTWAGKRLPTEDEWEFAARGGLEQKTYAWGNELTPGGNHYCNIWQGEFPKENTAEDGFIGTAPVKTYPENDYGLYQVAGNVWEWCANPYDKDAKQTNPANLSRAMRGGSYLCHQSYCNRYRVAARTSNTPDSSTGNLGFRCVVDA